jgi:K+-sensing histidine kinase KdpD
MAVNVVAPQTNSGQWVEPPVEPMETAQETLCKCLTDVSIDCAFLAKLRPRGNKTVLAIVAKRPREGKRMPSLTRSIRDAIRCVIAQGYPAFCVWQGRHSRWRHASALLAIPVTLSSGGVWGALVTVGRSPSMQIHTVTLVQELAGQLAKALSTSQLDCALPIQRSGGDEGPFVATRDVLTHELRVPLCAAAYALDALTHSCAIGRNSALKRLLHTAQSGVLEAQRILRWDAQLRALVREPVESMIGPTSVNEALNRALLLLPWIGSCVRVAASEDLPLVRADGVWLTQVFTNLLENAIRHAQPPEGVQVTVTQISQDRVQIAIVSAGAGVSPDERSALFYPHARKERSYDLTSQGLGLTIARYLIMAMGGDIALESDGRSHTTLLLTLVAASGEPK